MSLRVALAGFGTVGSAVARLLRDRHPDLHLAHVVTRGGTARRVPWVPQETVWSETPTGALADRVDVFVEVMGGLEPARSWVVAALEAGCDVVTANKQLLAHHGAELFALAAARGRTLACEAAVAGGVPVLRAAAEGIAGDRVQGVAGILNGTCNYILSRMSAAGSEQTQALAEAQHLGFAEADPSADLDGADAAAKLCVLARVAMGRHLLPGDVACRTIREVGAADLRLAAGAGFAVRQLAVCTEIGPGSLTARVGPALVPLGSSWASTAMNNNLVVLAGETGGDTGYFGAGAGGGPTSVAVVSDLRAIARGAPSLALLWAAAQACRVVPAPPTPFYVRAADVGGTHRLSQAAADAGVPVEHVLTDPGGAATAIVSGAVDEHAIERLRGTWHARAGAGAGGVAVGLAAWPVRS
jgi:homoserine dehydrogenase